MVRWNNSTLSPEANLFAKDTWNCDDKCGEEQDGHDCKGKDPLECNGLGEELTDTEGSSEDTKREADGIVLVGNEEEESVDQDAPDRNIGQDASCQVVGIDSDGTIPVQSNKCPCKWSRNNWDVNKSWVGIVSEVEGGEIEEINDQDDLRPDEVRSNE